MESIMSFESCDDGPSGWDRLKSLWADGKAWMVEKAKGVKQCFVKALQSFPRVSMWVVAFLMFIASWLLVTVQDVGGPTLQVASVFGGVVMWLFIIAGVAISAPILDVLMTSVLVGGAVFLYILAIFGLAGLLLTLFVAPEIYEPLAKAWHIHNLKGV